MKSSALSAVASARARLQADEALAAAIVRATRQSALTDLVRKLTRLRVVEQRAFRRQRFAERFFPAGFLAPAVFPFAPFATFGAAAFLAAPAPAAFLPAAFLPAGFFTAGFFTAGFFATDFFLPAVAFFAAGFVVAFFAPAFAFLAATFAAGLEVDFTFLEPASFDYTAALPASAGFAAPAVPLIEGRTIEIRCFSRERRVSRTLSSKSSNSNGLSMYASAP